NRPDSEEIGNGWIEKNPPGFSLSGNAVITNPDSLFWQDKDNIVYRPATEELLNVEASVEVRFFEDYPGYPQVHVRVQSDTVEIYGKLDSYLIFVDGKNNEAILGRDPYPYGVGKLATITIDPPLNTTDTFRLRLAAVGTDPVQLSAFVERFEGGDWQVIGQAMVNDDSPDRIDSAGSCGFGGWIGDNFQYDNYTYHYFCEYDSDCSFLDDQCNDGVCNVNHQCVAQSKANGTPCDDGLYCTQTDTCQDGICIGSGESCDDGVACTDDSCNEATDSCNNIPNDSLCDNGLWCDGAEICNAQSGCLTGTPPNCDDGVACTDDSCNEATDSCDNIANDANCDDRMWCNGVEYCDVNLDCQNGSPPDCSDDEEYCTGVEFCDEDNDMCGSTGNPCDPLICDDVDDVCIESTVSLIVLDSYGTPGTINISLENLEDEVSEVHFDLCDPEKHDWLNIIGTCKLTNRLPQGSSCQIEDLYPDDGCVTVIINTGSYIEFGKEPIVGLGYSLNPLLPMGEFADLVLYIKAVKDDIGESLEVTPIPGKVGSICQTDDDCNDYNECTTDKCNGGICEYVNITGACDDGLYCTENDICNDGICIGTARDCDDDLFCNGSESCDEVNDECVSSGNPCPPPWLCNERDDTCYNFPPTTTTTIPYTPCSIEISPSSAIVKSVDTVQFTAETTCNEAIVDGDYQWVVVTNIGSSIDKETGLYTAGINDSDSSVSDTIMVTDIAHDDITDTAKVTVKPKEPPVCEIAIEPSFATLNSGETITFTALIEGEGCLEPDYQWQIDTDINSEITFDGPTC
ncbi:MAG: Ig-like domain-containing protein, partial [Candidatus Thorarchaeota archaeon]